MDAGASDGVVGYRGRFVGNHVIRCSHVGNQKTCARLELVEDECNRMRRRVVEEGFRRVFKV